jgi:hypothetical protein
VLRGLRCDRSGGWFVPRARFHRLGLGNRDGALRVAYGGAPGSTLDSLPDDLGHRLINRTGVGLLLSNAELGQHVDDLMGGNL